MALSPLQQFLNRAIARQIPRAQFEAFFQLNQIKQGRVLKKIDATYYLIKLGPFRLLAKSDLPLQPHEQILVRVLALRPNLHLQLLPAKNESPESVRSHPDIESEVTEEFARTVVFYLADATQTRQPILRVSYFPTARKKQRPKINRIMLFIDFQHIGRTEVTVQSDGHGVQVNMTGSNQRWVAHLRQALDQLQSRLERIGKGTRVQIHVRHRAY